MWVPGLRMKPTSIVLLCPFGGVTAFSQGQRVLRNEKVGVLYPLGSVYFTDTAGVYYLPPGVQGRAK